MAYPTQVDMSQTITVAQGQSLSGAIDLGEGFGNASIVTGFIVPHVVEATTAQISFLASDTLAGTYHTVKRGGYRLTLLIAIDDYALLTNPSDLMGVRFLKVLCETSAGVAVSQATQADVFTVIKEGMSG